MFTRQHCAGAIVPAAATRRSQHRHDRVLTDIFRAAIGRRVPDIYRRRSCNIAQHSCAPEKARAPPVQGTFSHPKRRFANEREAVMSILKWALIMLLVSLVAALFGFTDLSAASADVARVLFYIFGVIFLVLIVLGLTAFRTR
jgi:uncharacterized membrane protein YtjA (UPF0391 family)